jgi:hypothetical protein
MVKNPITRTSTKNSRIDVYTMLIIYKIKHNWQPSAYATDQPIHRELLRLKKRFAEIQSIPYNCVPCCRKHPLSPGP